MKISFGRSLVPALLLAGSLSVNVVCAQSQPAKDPSGSQAGSSGKTRPDNMGSSGSTESPLKKCNPDTPQSDTKSDKKETKRKAKKVTPRKSSERTTKSQ